VLSKRIPTLLLVAATAAAATTGAIVTGADGGTGAAQAGATTNDPHARFGLLNRPSQAEDALPAELRAAATNASEHGADPALARRARTSGNAGRLWLIPGSTGLCVIRAGAEAAERLCASTEQAAGGQAIATTGGTANGLQSDERLLYGILPDGVGHVVVTLDDGDVRRVPVVDNAFAATLPALGGTVAWAGGSYRFGAPEAGR
jgi:hypothetical protein